MSIPNEILQRAADCLRKQQYITFLVGAGLSADSGIPTFRGKDGYWVNGSVNYKAEDIGTLHMFVVNPQEVWKWYLYRRGVTTAAQPNKGHFALKAIEDLIGDRFALVSQNVDGLHKRAGSSRERTYLIHGDFDYVRCSRECSDEWYPFPDGISMVNRDKNVITDAEWDLLTCPKCGELLRPNVLWFDEYYNETDYKLFSVLKVMENTGLLITLGTSGATGLPARMVDMGLEKQALVVEVNLDKTRLTDLLNLRSNGMIVKMGTSEFLEEFRDRLAEMVEGA